jgi:ATP-dependent Clp protease, protease subunit
VNHMPATDTWPWPPEVPRRPDQPPEPPFQPPARPQPTQPTPVLPSWEEPDPGWARRQLLDRLLEQRVVVMTGHLDEPMAEHLAGQLLLLDRTDPTRPIELHVSCRGSDLDASLSLAAGVDLARADVHAVVTGTLSGPAVAVLCAASERTAHRHATFVLGLPHAPAAGSAADPAARAEGHERAVAQLVERITAVSDQPAEQVEDDLRSGLVLRADEARDYGLVTAVV